MRSTEGQRFALAPHPVAPAGWPVRSIETRVARDPDGRLTLTYAVEGDVDRVRLPVPGPAHRADGLWRHTCFEAFVAPDDGPGYVELNFSPSNAWACYAFTGYRSGMAVADEVEAPVIAVAHTSIQLSVEVSVGLTCLRVGAAARIGLAAVIEETNGNLSYWALAHPPGRPDFHHPRGFALEI
jgi:hypothetical protein